MKHCSRCNRDLPDDDFYEWDHRKTTQCKACKRKRTAFYNDLHREKRQCFHCAKPLQADEKALCADCKAKRRAYYYQNHQQQLQNGKKRRLDSKQKAFDAYGGAVCKCCGETHLEFLTIDHIDGKGASHRRSIGNSGGHNFYRWLRTNGYPPGYQVLCFNCNFAKGHFGKCPHETENTS